MRNPILVLAALFLVGAPAWAQESRPASGPQTKPTTQPKKEKIHHDPAALKLYRSMTGRTYRPREHGLKSVRFHFKVTNEWPDGRRVSHGPYQMTWSSRGGIRVKAVGEIPKGGIPAAGISPAFLKTVLHDFIGYTPGDLIATRHLAMGRPGEVVITPTKSERARGKMRRIVLKADTEGRLGWQSVLGEKDYPLMLREYDYLAGTGKVLVEHVRISTGKVKKVKTYSYMSVGPFTFPKKTSSAGAGLGCQIIEYSHVELIRPDKKKP